MFLSPLFFWAAGSLVIALAGLFVSSKLFKIDLTVNGDLIVAMLTILGTLVSVLLGLLVSSADDQYRTLEDCVNSESTSINEIFRLSRGLPIERSYSIQDKCIAYCDHVVNEEWPMMREGKFSALVTKDFTDLSDAIVDFRPSNDGEANIQGALLSVASDVGQNRGLRVVASRSNWVWRLLPLIITCAVVVLACSYLYVGKGSAVLHAILVGLVAITLGINIGVIFLMTRPFSSDWAIQPEGFKLRGKIMHEYRHSRPPMELTLPLKE